MAIPKEYEGEVDFPCPSAGKPCKTWYKVIGDLKARTHTPLIALHGGPGMGHEYLTVLSELTSTHSIPLIYYDQLGNGRSTHLQEKNGDEKFWCDQLWLDELDNLINHLGIQDDYAILGHSWGGMLGARHATLQPKGLKQLIIADSPADMYEWVRVQNELKLQLPNDVQDALTKHEEARTWHEKEYLDAVEIFYKKFLCRLDEWPEIVNRAVAWIDQDPTVYHTV